MMIRKRERNEVPKCQLLVPEINIVLLLACSILATEEEKKMVAAAAASSAYFCANVMISVSYRDSRLYHT